VIRRALLATLQRFAAPRWNETAKHAWEMAYNRAATIMIEAAKRRRGGVSRVVDRHRARCSCTRSGPGTRSCLKASQSL